MPKSGRRRGMGQAARIPVPAGLRGSIRPLALAAQTRVGTKPGHQARGGHHAVRRPSRGRGLSRGRGPVRGRAAITPGGRPPCSQAASTRFERLSPGRAAITRPERPPGRRTATTQSERPPGRRTAATRFGRPASGSDSRDHPGQESGRLHAPLLGQLIPDRGGAFLAGKYRPSIRKTSHLIGGSSENAPAVGDGAASSGQLSEGKRPRIDDRHGVRHPCVENRRSCHLAEPPLATGPHSSCWRYMHSSLVRDEKSLDVCHGHAHFLQLSVALVRGFSSAAMGA
jgi:hypothetical protein